jgi:hypothetical protein
VSGAPGGLALPVTSFSEPLRNAEVRWNQPPVAVVPIEPPVEVSRPTFADGGESGCWPLDLSESFKAGKSFDSNLSDSFVVPCSSGFNVSMYPSS